jgi:hypothetical protein
MKAVYATISKLETVQEVSKAAITSLGGSSGCVSQTVSKQMALNRFEREGGYEL